MKNFVLGLILGLLFAIIVHKNEYKQYLKEVDFKEYTKCRTDLFTCKEKLPDDKN